MYLSHNSTPSGQVGLPIPPSEINIQLATSYGYGHGGKMGAGIPIIGLDRITSLMKGKAPQHANLVEKFTCRTCMETFTFDQKPDSGPQISDSRFL